MLATLATVVFLSAPALSVTPPSMTEPEDTLDVVAEDVVVEKGYGLQIIAVDAAGIAMMVAGASMESPALAYAGLGTMAFGPGVVHGAHGRSGSAIASMALRPSVVFAGMYLGAATENCSGRRELDFCGIGGAALGGLIAYGAVVAFDAAYLARARRARSINVVPRVAASPDGMQIGLGGSF